MVTSQSGAGSLGGSASCSGLGEPFISVKTLPLRRTGVCVCQRVSYQTDEEEQEEERVEFSCLNNVKQHKTAWEPERFILSCSVVSSCQNRFFRIK